MPTQVFAGSWKICHNQRLKLTDTAINCEMRRRDTCVLGCKPAVYR